MKKIVGLIVALIYHGSSYSQIQISSTVNSPKNGDHYGYLSGDISLSLGTEEANAYWNYYSIQPYLNQFNEFTIDTAGNIDKQHQFSLGNDFVIAQKNVREQNLLHLASGYQGDTLFEISSYDSQYQSFQSYDKALKVIHLPFAYLDEFRDSVFKTYALSSEKLNRRVKADAWGTISLPYLGSIECLRVVTFDTLVIKVCGALGCNNPITKFITTYEWYSDKEKQPVMIYKITETKGEAALLHRASILHNNVLNTQEVNDKGRFNIYPNPCDNVLQFPAFTGKIVIADSQGKIIFDELIFDQSSINTQKLSSGLYVISFISAEGIYLGSEKFSK